MILSKTMLFVVDDFGMQYSPEDFSVFLFCLVLRVKPQAAKLAHLWIAPLLTIKDL